LEAYWVLITFCTEDENEINLIVGLPSNIIPRYPCSPLLQIIN